MFDLISCFLLSRNKNIENTFSKRNIFLDLLKITFFVCFHFTKIRFLVSTENTKNEILLLSVFGCLRKYFH